MDQLRVRVCTRGIAAALLCVAAAHGGEVSGNQSGTWSAGDSPYVVTNTVTVPAGETLTIEAGVEVRFANTMGINVYGTLDAAGSEAAPVVLTSNVSQEADAWHSIYFQDGSAGTLTHCQIRYAGYWDDAAIVALGNAAPVVDHCLIADIDGDGIRIHDTASPSISNSEMTGVWWPIRSYGWNALPADLSGNVYGAVTNRGIRLDSPYVPAGETAICRAYEDGLPYSPAGEVAVYEGASLTIDPGVIVKLEGSQRVLVLGTLDARGTSTAPILFTAYNDDVGGDTNGDQDATVPEADAWHSVFFGEGGGGTLTHCQIRYAGYWDDAAIVVHGNAAPVIDQCLIADISGDGVRIHETASPSITNSEMTGVWWPIRSYGWKALPADLSGNVYGAVTNRGIRLDSPYVPAGETAVCRAYEDGLPYSPAGEVYVYEGARLTIEPGVIVKLEGAQRVVVLGTLDAQGMPTEPIMFTTYNDDVGGDTNGDRDATVPEADAWHSIHFADGSAGAMSYCQIRYAGHWDDAGIVVRGNAAPDIDHTEITHISGDGIRVHDASNPTLTPALVFAEITGLSRCV